MEFVATTYYYVYSNVGTPCIALQVHVGREARASRGATPQGARGLAAQQHMYYVYTM